MIEPQGPLPPEVYWRRRLVAIVGAVVAVAVVIALIVWAGSSSGGDADPANAAATSSAKQTPKQAAPAPSSAESSAAPSSEAPSGGGEHGAGGDPSAPASAPATPTDTSSPVENPCADQSLSVVLYTDKPTYTQGDQPVFTLVTTNGSLAACNRDVGKNAQNVIVRSLDGARTLWSAQDCAPDKSVDIKLLQPGQQVRDDTTWSGTTSSPGCKKPRQQIPAGAYQAVGKLGEKESEPITFNVVKPAQQ